MRVDIICAEDEMSMAANNIMGYADFLSRSIESYIAILAEVQEKGIKDDLVSSRLSAIASSLMPVKTSIFNECQAIAVDIKDNIAGVEAVDNFNFPADLTSKLSSLVAQFL
ncbi:hypothetical protein [Clostridium polynesiense]|uniref:hypothetical protein n=1 Tax=Clostridium polynesiense TaxID=1325933 RepID=UPI00058E286E|nr:hypothetical protein [Clostridium polynesiense]